MYCPRCTRDVPPDALSCPSCGARVTATRTWFTLTRVADRLSRFRVGDVVRSLLPGTRNGQPSELCEVDLQPGECELYRTELRSASLLVAYQHARLWDGATCLLSNRRLILCVPKSEPVQLPLGDIRAVNAYHHWDNSGGFSYWVAVYRVRSDFSDNRGNICLVCRDRQQSHELAAQIQSAIAVTREKVES
jgi:hypothetical protein